MIKSQAILITTIYSLIAISSAIAATGKEPPECKALLDSKTTIAQRLLKSRKCKYLYLDKSRARCSYSVGKTQISYEFKRNKTTKKLAGSYNTIVTINNLDPNMKVETANYANHSIGVSIAWKKPMHSKCFADSARIYKDRVSWSILLFNATHGKLLSTPKPRYLNEADN